MHALMIGYRVTVIMEERIERVCHLFLKLTDKDTFLENIQLCVDKATGHAKSFIGTAALSDKRKIAVVTLMAVTGTPP